MAAMLSCSRGPAGFTPSFNWFQLLSRDTGSRTKATLRWRAHGSALGPALLARRPRGRRPARRAGLLPPPTFPVGRSPQSGGGGGGLALTGAGPDRAGRLRSRRGGEARRGCGNPPRRGPRARAPHTAPPGGALRPPPPGAGPGERRRGGGGPAGRTPAAGGGALTAAAAPRRHEHWAGRGGGGGRRCGLDVAQGALSPFLRDLLLPHRAGQQGPAQRLQVRAGRAVGRGGPWPGPARPSPRAGGGAAPLPVRAGSTSSPKPSRAGPHRTQPAGKRFHDPERNPGCRCSSGPGQSAGPEPQALLVPEMLGNVLRLGSVPLVPDPVYAQYAPLLQNCPAAESCPDVVLKRDGLSLESLSSFTAFRLVFRHLHQLRPLRETAFPLTVAAKQSGYLPASPFLF